MTTMRVNPGQEPNAVEDQKLNGANSGGATGHTSGSGGLEFDIDEAVRQLSILDPNADAFTFQTFDDDKVRKAENERLFVEECKKAKEEGRKPRLKKDPYAKTYNGPFDARLQYQLAERNQDRAGVFITVNETDGKGRKLSNITSFRCVFCECDNHEGKPLAELLKAFPIESSLVVETSTGRYHFYWLFAEKWPNTPENEAVWRGVEARLVADYGSDPNACDPARVLRLPGFYHCKRDPFLVRIVSGDGRRYSREDILAAFPPMEAAKAKGKRDKAKAAPKANGEAPAFTGTEYRGHGSRPYSKRDELELRSASKFVRVDRRITWVAKCFAFLRLGWRDVIAFDIFHEICSRSNEYQGRDDCLALWEKCKSYLGTSRATEAVIEGIFREAIAKGWQYPFTHEDFAGIAKLEDATEIEKFNAEFALIEDPVSILDVKKGKLLNLDRFKLLTGNRWVNSGGNPILLATKWIGSRKQRRHKGVVFDPGQPRVTGGNHFNLWEGFKVKPIRGNSKPFVKLVLHVCNDDKVKTRYILQYFAHMIQRPHVKILTSPFNYVKMTGVGKSLIVEKFGELLGEYFKVVGRKEIHSTTNTYLYKSLLVYIDEALFSDKRELSAFLKALITQKKVRINEKYAPVFDIESFANFYFSSNYADGVLIENEDRRFYPIPAPKQRLPKAFYDLFDEKVPGSWWNSGGKEAVMYLLTTLPLTGFDPHAPAPMTEEKKTLIDLGRGESERRAAAIFEQFEGSDEPLQRVEDLLDKSNYVRGYQGYDRKEYDKDLHFLQTNIHNEGAARKRPRIEKDVTEEELRLWPAKDARGKPYKAGQRLTLWAVADPEKWDKAKEGGWARQFRWQQMKSAVEQLSKEVAAAYNQAQKEQAQTQLAAAKRIFAELNSAKQVRETL